MSGRFTDSNLHTFEVRSEQFGTLPHVVVEWLTKDGRYAAGAYERVKRTVLLMRADEAEQLIALIRDALDGTSPAGDA